VRVRTVLGFGVGYVLGARAGRERYEQLKGWWNAIHRSDTARAISARLPGPDAAKRAAAGGLSAAADRVRRLGD
jgi:hypothetical protein